MVKPLAVVAVGGNALIQDEQRNSIPDQYVAVMESVQHIVDMVEAGWDLVLTHGNGPQVGFILRRSELASNEVSPVPLDYAVGDTQGAIGYMFQKALHGASAGKQHQHAGVFFTLQLFAEIGGHFGNMLLFVIDKRLIVHARDHQLALLAVVKRRVQRHETVPRFFFQAAHLLQPREAVQGTQGC